MMNGLDDEILEWYNRQNRNKFEAEEEQNCQDFSGLLIFLEKWREYAEILLDKMIKASYGVKR